MTLRNSFQVDDVNLESRSDMMSRGSPCSLHISLVNLRARSAAVLALSFRGMKWAILVNQSITTHSSMQPFDKGQSVMKSMDIDCHGAYGSSRGDIRPYCLWRLALFFWQSGQDLTYSSISLIMLGHQKFRRMSSIVLSMLKCAAIWESCSDWRILGTNCRGMYMRGLEWSMSFSKVRCSDG